MKKPSDSIFYITFPVFLLIIITFWRTAWVCDDAFITFRVIDNFYNGYGLVWNVVERVQVYTHPLWMMLLLVWFPIIGGLYSTAIFLSFCFLMLFLILFIKMNHKNYLATLVGLLLLLFSKAFIDFSSSGLENPLTHFLLLLVVWLCLDYSSSLRNNLAMGLAFSALFLTRMDAILLIVPVVMFRFSKLAEVKSKIAFIVGLIPIVIWELFSLIYYGFLFPNTAYAKLQTGIHWTERLSQGFAYVSNSIIYDPITFPVILLAIVIPFFYHVSQDRFSFLTLDKTFVYFSVGLLVYVGYVISIGGDFMTGRFWTPAFVVSVVLFTQILSNITEFSFYVIVIGIIAIVGLLNPLSPVRSTTEYYRQNRQLFDANQISDERAMVFETLGLANRSWNDVTPDHPRVDEALRIRAKNQKVAMHGAVGLFGYYVGPNVYVLDYYALTDPLLARLPGVKNLLWRPGHIRRTLPKGYEESLPDDDNKIKDQNLAQYYDHIRTITRGPLFSWQRWKNIVQYHLGYFDELIHEQDYRYPGMIERSISELQKPLMAGDQWDHPNALRIYAGGVRINLAEETSASRIKLFLDSDDTYGIVYFNENQEIAQQVLEPIWEELSGMHPRIIEVPNAAQRKGFTAIHVMPLRGDRQYSVGDVEIME